VALQWYNDGGVQRRRGVETRVIPRTCHQRVDVGGSDSDDSDDDSNDDVGQPQVRWPAATTA